MLFVGFIALSNAAQDVEPTALNGTNASATAYNTTEGIINGLGQAMSPAVVFGGVGAFVVVVLGYLVVAGNSGR